MNLKRCLELTNLPRGCAVVLILTLCVASRLVAQAGPSTANVAGLSQSPFLGSVPTGRATGTAIPLTIRDAVERALKYNLGVIESQQGSEATRATRLRSLSNLLPSVSADLQEVDQQTNLRALGLNIPIIPYMVGPFGVTDARASLHQTVFSWSALKNYQSASESLKASQLSYKSARDLVVLATGNAYLTVIASAAQVESLGAQVKTAQALYQKVTDQKKAGVVAGIDELRAQVELQTVEQRLIAQENQLAKDKLSLGRVIGLPNGQQFDLADSVPFAPLEGIALDQVLQRAYDARPDFQSAQAQVRAAQLARRAAVAENYPTLSFDANYGDIGPNFAHSHGTFAVAGTLNIPIYLGGRVHADVVQADAALAQRRAELEDLRGRIDDQVRSAFLDLQSASRLVKVAQSNIDLAHRTLTQAQDRFAAGVTDNIEVVQAQESVAAAEQSYIASLYAHNLAKVSLAQAMGIAEESALKYLGGK